MKSFLICPVRGMSPDAHATAVDLLEKQGFSVHWPPRDTDQNDEIGLRICMDNARAIAAADVVHIIWDGKSQGCLFDLGVAFALKKKLEIVLIPAISDGKSFQNMMAAWACEGPAMPLEQSGSGK